MHHLCLIELQAFLTARLTFFFLPAGLMLLNNLVGDTNCQHVDESQQGNANLWGKWLLVQTFVHVNVLK